MTGETKPQHKASFVFKPYFNSGGPIQATLNGIPCVYNIVGLTSFGNYHCGTTGKNNFRASILNWYPQVRHASVNSSSNLHTYHFLSRLDWEKSLALELKTRRFQVSNHNKKVWNLLIFFFISLIIFQRYCVWKKNQWANDDTCLLKFICITWYHIRTTPQKKRISVFFKVRLGF